MPFAADFETSLRRSLNLSELVVFEIRLLECGKRYVKQIVLSHKTSILQNFQLLDRNKIIKNY
jgi:predicted Mrr-cat superfamily restriction endonuclease